jgi:hypothetical protein
MRTKAFAMAAGALVLAAFTLAGQDGAIRNQADLRRSLASARTAADHARIAAYYRQAAQAYRQKQAEEEGIAAQWQKQYERWTKTPNPYQSAKNLAAYYGQRAGDALARAMEQDKLAGK